MNEYPAIMPKAGSAIRICTRNASPRVLEKLLNLSDMNNRIGYAWLIRPILVYLSLGLIRVGK